MSRRRTLLIAAAVGAMPGRGRGEERPPLPDDQPDPATLPPVSLPLLDLCMALHTWGRGLLTRPHPAAVLAFPALSEAFAGLAWRQFQLAQSLAMYLNARWGKHQAEGDAAVRAVAVLTEQARALVERADALTPEWRPDSLDVAVLARAAENDAEAFRYDGLVLDALDTTQWGRSWEVIQALFFALLRFSEEAQTLAGEFAAASR
jgi:hypothetical protein